MIRNAVHLTTLKYKLVAKQKSFKKLLSKVPKFKKMDCCKCYSGSYKKILRVGHLIHKSCHCDFDFDMHTTVRNEN